MIDFNKITSDELQVLKDITNKAAEKSDLEKYYLFTNSPIEKAKLFIFCHRFLINIHSLLDDGDLRIAISETINETHEIYFDLIYLINLETKGIRVGSNKRILKIINIINKKEIDDIIDLFSVLTEKLNVIQISKLKGILLEGKSGEEYKRLFKEKE